MTAGALDLRRPIARARLKSLAGHVRLELIWFAILMGIVGLAHGVNMFDYPFYENDEGTYMSQAWSLVSSGELAPYTYWYDHAPFGWIQIAAWTLLTGGFYTFGETVESGRVLMLLYQLGCAALVYLIARRLTGSVFAATVAVLLFGLSAYGIYFHRRVLLDNIAAFWALLSLWILVAGPMRLWRAWLSALCLALGILSKELVVFLVPALAYVAWYRAHPSQRILAGMGWLAIAGAVTSLYALLAVLKGELFPTGTLLGGDTEHVSLLGSVSYQASRVNEGGGGFWGWAATWASIDPVLIVGGTAAAALNVLLWRRNPTAGAVGLMVFLLGLFLARGGVVIEFYLVPALPFLALSFVLVLHRALSAARRMAIWRAPVGRVMLHASLALGILGGATWGYAVSDALGMGGSSLVFWTSAQAQPQRLAIDWVRDHLAPADVIVIDAYTWTDLHDPPDGLRSFDLAHYYWKVDLDPEIRDDVLGGDWRSIDYLMETPQMRKSFAGGDGLVLGATALEHSTELASWDADGWPVSVRRVDKVRSIPVAANSILGGLWTQYKAAFLDGGRVVDPAQDGRTTSEGQAYAMLQAVYHDDRATFDAVWEWTKETLQQPSGLFAWSYGRRENGAMGVLDRGAATDGDQDIALALLFASQRWDAASYREEASPIMGAIWRDLTAVVDGRRYIVAGQWAADAESPVVNPSYLAPYAYRIFADADPAHDWNRVVDSSYRILSDIAASPELGASIGAPPNWVAIHRDTGELSLSTEMGDYGARFSFDASRVPWRLALDWMWFREERAKQLLEAFDLPRQELERTGRLAAEYRLDGSVFAEYESISMYAGTLPGLLLGGAEELAYDVLATEIMAPLLADDAEIGYYDRNWAWFAIALVDGGISNLWDGAERHVWADPLRAGPGDGIGP